MCIKAYIVVSGKPHRFTMLSDLMSELMTELDKLRAEAQQKETEADSVVKDTMKHLRCWDETTHRLINQLHQDRDQFVSYSVNPNNDKGVQPPALIHLKTPNHRNVGNDLYITVKNGIKVTPLHTPPN